MKYRIKRSQRRCEVIKRGKSSGWHRIVERSVVARITSFNWPSTFQLMFLVIADLNRLKIRLVQEMASGFPIPTAMFKWRLSTSFTCHLRILSAPIT